MATGPEHYRRAEQLLERAAETLDTTQQPYYVWAANTHAVLAHAAATALAESGSMPGADFDAWEQAAAVSPTPPTTWTDPATGTTYDLTRQYADSDGDVWKLSGWVHHLDGRTLPIMSALADHDLRDVELPDVIKSYGPLTAREEAGS
jgi:hypothetical protein